MEFLVLIAAVMLIIIATLKFKVNPVISLVLAAIFVGFGFGLPPESLLQAISRGFGNTLSGIGLVIAYGTIIGIYLEKTGGTRVMADSILKVIGLKRAALALNLAGFVISIPVYCDSGFVILSSLNKALSKKTGVPFLVFAIALATGLYAAHVFVPPTPGPLAAASILGADLGSVLLLGLLVALVSSLAGFFWASYMGRRVDSSELKNIDHESIEESPKPLISPLQAFLPIIVPVVLIALKSMSDYPSHPFGEGFFAQTVGFLGAPTIALLIGVFFAFLAGRKATGVDRGPWMGEALKQAGAIILITGAGGAFGEVIRAFDFASSLDFSATSGVGGLLLCFAMATLLKSAQGSSTVAIITTAAIAAPLLETFELVSMTQKALAVLAIGAGAMTVSHVNDSYFWVVSQFSHMNVKTALRAHTLATLVQGVTAITLIIFLFYILK